MDRFRKLQLVGALAASLWFAPGFAQDGEPVAKVDELFAELQQPGREDYERVETQILREWSHSGSSSMDLLLRRGKEALEAENLPEAVEHFSALTDHAPDFAEGWNMRGTTFYLMGEFSLAMADFERVLVLEPRHFEALYTLGAILEQMNEPGYALMAFEQVEVLSPNRESAKAAVIRLRRLSGDVEL